MDEVCMKCDGSRWFQNPQNLQLVFKYQCSNIENSTFHWLAVALKHAIQVAVTIFEWVFALMHTIFKGKSEKTDKNRLQPTPQTRFVCNTYCSEWYISTVNLKLKDVSKFCLREISKYLFVMAQSLATAKFLWTILNFLW